MVILVILVILIILVIVRTGNCTDTCVFFISLGDAQSDLEPQLSLSGVSFDGETDTRVADIEARRHRDHHERRVRGSRGQGCQARQGQGEQGEETSRSSRGCREFILILIFVWAICKNDAVFCSQDRRRRLGVKKGSSFFGGVATAFHGGDGFKTDVKARALAREKAMGASHFNSRTRTRDWTDTSCFV